MEEGKSHESPWSLSDMNFFVVKPNTFLKSSYLLSHFIGKVQVRAELRSPRGTAEQLFIGTLCEVPDQLKHRAKSRPPQLQVRQLKRENGLGSPANHFRRCK
ncbi:hypothetical protein AV530_002913 [Patagioenas fasciata monilis]|uniref:Uncharacterized protein n=1 Tax=Patagioenas fasciata monilis TaxID=372326 RepID=A0A1V4K9T2_PATFA|nr:hypothetical protein AV530_002913 [Patagioenas fasciata monilis]